MNSLTIKWLNRSTVREGFHEDTVGLWSNVANVRRGGVEEGVGSGRDLGAGGFLRTPVGRIVGVSRLWAKGL